MAARRCSGVYAGVSFTSMPALKQRPFPVSTTALALSPSACLKPAVTDSSSSRSRAFTGGRARLSTAIAPASARSSSIMAVQGYDFASFRRAPLGCGAWDWRVSLRANICRPVAILVALACPAPATPAAQAA
jgi:hypothetical protein